MPSGDKVRLAILASGTGSNADQICTYFKAHPDISVELIVTNRREAGVRQVAAKHEIQSVYLPGGRWADQEGVLHLFENYGITHLVLAGFLLLLPEYLVRKFKGRILNIHPALLPRHGGQGMFGHHVHQAVKDSGDLVSGITIHEVNEEYDQGRIIFQKEVNLSANDSAKDIARKVLELEHTCYPEIIESWVKA